jgi:hypothetical protein
VRSKRSQSQSGNTGEGLGWSCSREAVSQHNLKCFEAASRESLNNRDLLKRWATGKEVGRTTLGKSPIFNTMGGFFIPMDNGDIYITGAFRPVRISKDK